MLCLATLPGCSSLADLFGSGKPLELSFPAVVDFADVRCPATDAATHNEWKRVAGRPAQWGKPGPDGKPTPALRGELEDYIDKLELGEARKNGTGQRMEVEYEHCRQPAGAPSS